MKVKVTKDHIENAIKKDSNHCMIADAIHAADPDAKFVQVDVQSIRWSNLKKGERYIALTPPRARHNILAYDFGKSVLPFMFTVNPQIVKKVGWKANHPNSSRKGKKYRSTGKKRPRVVKHREFGVRMFVEA